MASDLTRISSRKGKLRLLSVPALALIALSTRPAHAEPSAADRATARALAQEGGQALDRKDYELAADRFARADALVHVPTLVLELAHAQVGLGKYVEAHENLLRILREGVEPNAHPLFLRAYRTAQIEEKEIAAKISWVTMHIESGGAPLNMTLDGEELPRAALDVKRAVNPGKHVLRVSGEGYKTNETAFDVEEGKTVSLTVSLENLARKKTAAAPLHGSEGQTGTSPSPPPSTSTPPTGASSSAGAAPESGAGSAAPTTAASPSGKTSTGRFAYSSSTGGMKPSATTWVASTPAASRQQVGAWATLGLGGAAIIVGGVAGLLAVGDRRLLERTCTGDACPPSARSDVDHYHTMANLSTVAFAVGGAALAASLVLHWTAPKRESPRLEAFAGIGTAGARVTFE